jgi:hypothetical protein
MSMLSLPNDVSHCSRNKKKAKVVKAKRLQSLQESLTNIKANQSMMSLQTSLATEVDREKSQGILAMMRKTLFGDEDEDTATQAKENDERFSTSVTVDLDKTKSTWDVSGEQPPQKSVLDQLETYWEEHDAQGGNNNQFGIMAKQADDMMLMRGQKGGKRSGAFCVGI